jgi:hypothetical protein
MSDELTEEYSPEPEPAPRGGFPMDAFVPLVLLSISFIVLLGWQVSNTTAQRTLLENAITRQEPAVTQSHQVQAGLAKLAEDLLQAAQTDDTAKAIAAKYIQHNGGAAATPAGP